MINPVAQEDKRFVPYQKDKGLMPRKIKEVYYKWLNSVHSLKRTLN